MRRVYDPGDMARLLASMSAVGVTARPGSGDAAGSRRRLAGGEAEIAVLCRQVALASDRVVGVKADNAQLTEQVERLQARLETSRRAGKRQAALVSPATPRCRTRGCRAAGLVPVTGPRRGVDHDGDEFLRDRLTVYTTNACSNP